MRFLIERIAAQHPTAVVQMIGRLAGLRRAIEDHPLYSYVEPLYGVKVADLTPRVANGELRWFEYPEIGAPKITERRLTLNPFGLLA